MFAEKFKKLRTDNNMSIPQLSKILNISNSSMTR